MNYTTLRQLRDEADADNVITLRVVPFNFARMIVGLADHGSLILAIQTVRGALGCGLHEAKDIVDIVRTARRYEDHNDIANRVSEAIIDYMGR
jgi:ribosomal protein L7/L12